MKIKFTLNTVEFECEFTDVKEMVEFIIHLAHNNNSISLISLNLDDIKIC